MLLIGNIECFFFFFYKFISKSKSHFKILNIYIYEILSIKNKENYERDDID